MRRRYGRSLFFSGCGKSQEKRMRGGSSSLPLIQPDLVVAGSSFVTE